VKRFILIALSLTACNWTQFDDLSNQAWAHSHQKPSIGSTNYAISIVGASTSGDGGLVAVVSTDSPTFSTIQYDAKGGSKTGDSPLKLGQHFIVSLSEKPILVTDGMGDVALVEKAIDAGQIAVVSGPAGQPADLAFAGSPPQAATYAGKTLYIAAAAAGANMPNLFVVDGVGPTKNCTVTDDAGMPLTAGALAADATNLWVWGKTGAVFAYPLATLAACTATAIPATHVFMPAAAFSPGTGARVNILTDTMGHELAVLAGHADKATNGEAVVLDLVPATPTQLATMPADGVLSSTVATFDGMTYLVLGFPNKEVNNVTAGDVEIYDLDRATGALGTTAAETLFDAQPENGQLFGRDVTTMEFNGHTVLVVAASNEVFSYYRTSLYPTDTRNPPP
jgi:hypothetical protein